MKISILTENKVKKRGLLAEHGLSIFIEHENTNILFDTGQSAVYCQNAQLMGVDLQSTDLIVLSHGHYDHCGGLIHFKHQNAFPPVYIHPAAFAKRYARSKKNAQDQEVGIPWSLDDHPAIKQSIRFNQTNGKLIDGVHLLCEIPSAMAFEDPPTGFYKDCEGSLLADLIADEQILVFERANGLTVFLGCSHRGVINCLQYVQNCFPGRKIHSVVAGMHMENVSAMRLQKTIEHLRNMDIQRVVPLHCTGLYAIVEMKKQLGDRCEFVCAGDTMDL